MTNTLNGLTAAGSILGTPAFLPPEQASGRLREIDARTDLWALGATMYKLLSGRYVHDAETATQIIILAATQPAPSIAWAIGGTAPALVPVVDRALAFERDARWPSAEAMRAAVREAYRTLSGGALPTRESLAEVFGIGTWETKFAEVLKPPPGTPSGSLPLPGVIQARGRATAPMPVGQRQLQPTAPMPQAATAQPVEQSIGTSVPMNKSRWPLVVVGVLGLALVGLVVAFAVVFKATTSNTAPSAVATEVVRVAPSAPASSFAIAAPPPPSASTSPSASATPVASIEKPVAKPSAQPSAKPACHLDTIYSADGTPSFKNVCP
jgi:serine/threonine-protein kinase